MTESRVHRTEQPKDGLPGGSVALISKDNHGVVWFSTTKGLAAFENDRLVRFDQDGLQAAGISGAARR